MKAVTFNIRGDFGVDGNNNFCFRKPLILKKLAAEQPDVIGFQEVMPHVAVWLRENLKDYYVVGCGRDADLGGEQMTVAFRKDKYNLLEMRTFWMSETPYVPASRYEDQSDCPRVSTEVVLQELGTSRVIRVLNTHLDHRGAGARRLGLGQIMRHLESAQLFPEANVILMGDFNAPPWSEEMQLMKEYPSYVNATEGIGITFHGFGGREEPEYIDYIYVRGRCEIGSVTKWEECEDGVYLSDHYPVCAEIAFKD